MKAQDRRAAVAYSDGVMEDLKALPSRALLERAIWLIHGLVNGHISGPELERDLRGARRYYFDTPEEESKGRVRWRIVYQQLPPAQNSQQPVIHIIAIGDRHGMAVYDEAARRLGRQVDPGPDPGARTADRQQSAGRRPGLHRRIGAHRRGDQRPAPPAQQQLHEPTSRPAMENRPGPREVD
jgi:hypothetical protein